ncbi:hypothetical protein DICPUDRAFT_26223 [Dictyostelium purpureum]|uniref:Smr domain-containing protein n=1 Tax=Dictyostelium purpureum TaxID=5786 RepID=F0Z8D4_DICPU|nr:uncharacterized protein DICPUDRAFT_26223 [Dictyostelium purpureum]EGC39820.1 hypothetical protein DICPUDRAFT_26223 [Dictyostelium purpureum]|eukprot:XP_003283687.1 hypothetical protein DICPUDRAFT_26223 [Dictyostelium purpureum]
MVFAAVAAVGLYFLFKSRLSVTKEEIIDVDTLHKKLEKEIIELKKQKKNHLVQPTVDDFCDQIFKICNEGKNKYTIDLHGLFVAQSLKYLNERIYNLNKEKYTGTLVVITGKGNHSKDNLAKIKPSVKEFLKKNNFQFKEMDGSFSVSLDKSKVTLLK